jgi:hypothetical protein
MSTTLPVRTRKRTDAATVMEAGLILPRPGGEAEWFKNNQAALVGVHPNSLQKLQCRWQMLLNAERDDRL